MKKEIRLYNILFPVWMFFVLPTPVWILILPANFAIDSLVLWLAARHYKLGAFKLWEHSIARIWIIGFLSDFIGAALILSLMLLIEGIGLSWDTFHFPGTTLLSLPGVVLAGWLIDLLNRHFAFKKCKLDAETICRLSLLLAIFTAPYAMLIPLYG